MVKITPLLALASGLFAVSIEGTPTSKRQTTQQNFVKDGSFEQIPSSYAFHTDFSAGGWNFTGRAGFVQNDGCTPPSLECTPYGNNFVDFYKAGGGTAGSVFQRVHGLSTAAQYTLSYAYEIAIAPGGGCSVTSLLGSQVVDTLEVPPGAPNFQAWMNRTATFTPAKPGGTLMFRFHCSAAQRPVSYEICFDNVKLLGPV